jgi:hypothetical protein
VALVLPTSVLLLSSAPPRITSTMTIVRLCGLRQDIRSGPRYGTGTTLLFFVVENEISSIHFEEHFSSDLHRIQHTDILSVTILNGFVYGDILINLLKFVEIFVKWEEWGEGWVLV